MFANFFYFSSLQMLNIITIVLSLTFATKGEEHSAFFRVTGDHFLVDENIIWDQKGESLLSCSQKCARREDCKSANYMTDDGRCFSAKGEQKMQKCFADRGHFLFGKSRFPESKFDVNLC